MSFVEINNIKIEGENIIVFQGSNGSEQRLTIDAFVNSITKEKDSRIKLLEQAIEDKTKIEKFSENEIYRLGRELTQLKTQRSFQEARINDMLREFEGKDLSVTSKLYQEAFNLFMSGKLEEAFLILDDDKLEKQEEQALAIRIQQSETRLLKAQISQLTFKFEEAAKNFEKAAQNFPSWKTHIEIFSFYQKQHNYDRAEAHLLEAYKYVARDLERVRTLNQFGNFYSLVHDKIRAQEKFDEAIKICKQSLSKDLYEFLPELAVNLNDLGLVYCDDSKFEKSELVFKEALFLFQRLKIAYPDRYSNEIASTFNNLGNCYLKFLTKEKLIEAERNFNEALGIYIELEKEHGDIYIPNIAAMLNNLGALYKTCEYFVKSENCFSVALDMRFHMARKNKDAYLPDVASSFNNLGALYTLMDGKKHDAEIAFKEAYETYKLLSLKNPDVFLPYVALTLKNLGILFHKVDFLKSINYYEESALIFRRLLNEKPDNFELNLASLLILLGDSYENYDNEKSQVFFIESKVLCEKHSEKLPAQELINELNRKLKYPANP
jgi:tetratricopeptide (TPR) repeat protein